jgi:uncharacterized protein (DUF1800 family)
MEPLQQKAHFLRRATGGATLEELNRDVAPATWLSQWLNTPPVTVPQLPGLPNDPKLLTEIRQQLINWILTQTITASNPFHERIVSFWRDYFVISLRKTNNPYMVADYERRLRTYAFGDFQELLFQVTTSPAMLHFLDGRQNRKGNINENYSREVKELFTIGRGNYTETDVQEGARALTGWRIETDLQAGTTTSVFRPGQHDNGRKTYLGQTGNFKTEDVVAILANHPQTSRNLATRLWSTFVYPNPEASIIDRLAAVYRQNNRSLGKLIEAVFTSPEFYSERAYRSQIRTPQEFMTGSLRQLQIQADPKRVGNALRSMGQPFYNPATVRGWTNDEGWLTAPSLITRLNLARQFTLSTGDAAGFKFDREKFSKEALLALLLDNNPGQSIGGNTSNLSIGEFAALLLSTPLYQLA